MCNGKLRTPQRRTDDTLRLLPRRPHARAGRLSYAPVDDSSLALLRDQLAGWNDDPAGFDWDWRSVGEYLDRLDRGVAVNAAYLVPQGSVRMLAPLR